MLRRFPMTLALAAGILLAPAASLSADDPAQTLTTEKERVSYAIGLNLGHGMVSQDLDLDVDLVIQGIRTVLAGEDPLLSEDEVMAVLQAFQQQMVNRQQERMAAQAAEAEARGSAFLAENAQRDGVVTRESGLQYEVLTEGNGPSPTLEDTVVVHYHGTLIDGTVFDSSHQRGEPATFPLSGIIPGWQEALPLMSVGSKWRLVIPPDLAYGPQGTGGPIGPNEVLIFEVELLGVEGAGQPGEENR
jgi:FKBP-type peptidyl-prolyl cis-trans isomerase